MAVEFHGSWRLVSSENFEAYLKELGINVVLRKLAFLVTPTVTFSSQLQDGGSGSIDREAIWTMK